MHQKTKNIVTALGLVHADCVINNTSHNHNFFLSTNKMEQLEYEDLL
jgi:hypothetical protein